MLDNVLTKSLGFFYLLSVYIFDKLQSSATFTSFVCIHIIHVLHQCLNKITIYSLKNNHISRGNKSSYLLTIHLINWYFFFILKQPVKTGTIIFIFVQNHSWDYNQSVIAQKYISQIKWYWKIFNFENRIKH